MSSAPTKYQWNLSSMYKDDNDPRMEKDRELVKEKSYAFINKWKDRYDYLRNPKILKEALDEYEEWNHYFGTDGTEGFYYWLRTEQDQSNTDLKAKFNKIIEFSQKVGNDIQFFTHRIAKIAPKYQEKFLKSRSLKDYRHFLQGLFDEAKYLLSEQEEKILSLQSKTSHYNWVKMTSEFLAKEEREVIVNDKGSKENKSFSEIMSLMDNTNKESRDSAAIALNDILIRWVDVAENEINSVLENKKVSDELRKIDRPDKTRHISDDIDTEVVDALVSSVQSSFNVSEKFYKLKAKLLGVDKLKYHERNLPYGLIDKEYNFEDAIELVSKVFENLDPDFLKIFEGFINEGRVDVYPKKGKVSGAFMANGLKSNSIYILLNYTDKLNDVLTLAHEVGHGIHYTLAKKQNAINFGASLSTAEVASTFMEDFVLQEITKEADDELKLALIMMKLNDDISTIHRQVSIYKFEQDLHREFRSKGYLAKADIGALFLQNMKAYMGNAVELSEGSENWWMYVSHIRNFFYVYSYASGLLISKSMQDSVKKDKKFVKKVKEFFESGESKSPKDIFMELGIDITDKIFWAKGLKEVEDLVDEAENLAKRLGKI